MKLKDPTMFTPAYWARMHTLSLGHESGVATARAHSVNVSFPVKENAKGELVIANHSPLEITHTGHNDPDWRNARAAQFNVRCAPAKDLAGLLWCPHTARKVSVSRIVDNPVLWVDTEARTAMLCRGLKYETADGPPIASEGKIKYSFDNPKATKAFMARLMPILREAKLRCALLELEPVYHRGQMLEFLRGIRKSGAVDVEGVVGAPTLRPHTDIANSHMRVLAWGLDRVACDKDFLDEIKNMCADQYSSNYLEYRP